MVVFLALTSVCWTACAMPAQSFEEFLTDYQCGYDVHHAQPLNHKDQALDVAIAVEGVYFDGEWLIAGWRTDNLRPQTTALVLYAELLVNGQRVSADADYPIDIWSPNVFDIGNADHPDGGRVRGARFDVSGMDLGGEVEITARFIVKRPYQPMVMVNAALDAYFKEMGYAQADIAARKEAIKSHGVTIAGPGEMDPEAWQDKGYFVVDGHGWYAVGGEYYSALDLNELAAYGSGPFDTDAVPPDMERGEMDITFTLNLDKLKTGD